MSQKSYLVLAFYHLKPLVHSPQKEITLHKDFFSSRDVTCRIYISEGGINAQMSAVRVHAQEYMDWMKSREEFKDIVFKIHEHHENVFPRKTVKYRAQLVAYDAPTDLSSTGKHLSPEEWNEKLKKDEEHILLDIRNDYEWKIGRFEGAELPPCENFREFRGYAEELKTKVDPKKTPVMMYCTGGIRCELFSAVLKEKGFEKVYQLEGGIINYGLKQGNDHWLGKLFVFDDRLAVPLAEENGSVIATCHHCEKAQDSYYNCANMDCNQLFICCPDCLKVFAGCCQEECKTAKRVRPYHACTTHKPFRRKHHYQTSQETGAEGDNCKN